MSRDVEAYVRVCATCAAPPPRARAPAPRARQALAQASFRHLRSNLEDTESGIPIELVTDNGPAYSSAEFKNFLESWEVRHTASSTHYPQSNGKSERAVQSVKNILKKVIAKSSEPRSYIVEDAVGRCYRRNRRHLVGRERPAPAQPEPAVSCSAQQLITDKGALPSASASDTPTSIVTGPVTRSKTRTRAGLGFDLNNLF
ncbi:unnamed protein product [Pieris macdunnoughi]|uniref:Integrase catalytic domain-containing protein n=1 Tax=Pieris macdunnoughi TaxID=345717 RepID=A0A821L5X7_9NEOP|nr:unnamed protein product [Pieris macdunnoughi]